MSADIAIIAGSSAAGVISAAILDRLSSARAAKNKPAKKTPNAARGELTSLLFERSLTSEAISRVYEATQKQKIDRLERDRLLLRYKEQLDSLNGKISELQPVADYDDISHVRNNLVALLENSISALDRKLVELSKAGAYAPSVDDQVHKIVSDITKGDAGPQDPNESQLTAEEKSIAQLQKEIMQALQRLEQVEIDKE